MNVNWLIDSALASIPSRGADVPAIGAELEGSWSLAELAARRDHYVRVLTAVHVSHGDRVALLTHNSLDFVAVYFAAARIGALTVRVNFRLAAREVAFILNDSRSSVVFYGIALESVLDEARGHVVNCAYVRLDEADVPCPPWALAADEVPEAQSDPVLEDIRGGDPLTIMYTSGTTGLPKGSVWTHDNAMWFFASEAIGFGFGPDTVTLTTGPLYHAGSFECHLLPTILAGGRGLFLGSGSFSIQRVLDVCRAERVTDVLLFPDALYALLRLDVDVLREYLPALRAITSGGDAIMSWALRALSEKLPDVRFDQGYGLTEGGGVVAMLEDRYRATQAGSVGRPLPFAEIRVLDSSGQDVAVGEQGEIAVRGPNVSAGYWQRPEANVETYHEGWCHTGDQGTVSDDGFLRITGRIKDMFRSGGENVYPAEVESVLTEHPAVLDAAVVGVPDDRFLEAGCAVVVLASDECVTDDALDRHCRASLARYKCPKYYVRVDALPRTASGKLQKHLLREAYRDIGQRVGAG